MFSIRSFRAFVLVSDLIIPNQRFSIRYFGFIKFFQVLYPFILIFLTERIRAIFRDDDFISVNKRIITCMPQAHIGMKTCQHYRIYI